MKLKTKPTLGLGRTEMRPIDSGHIQLWHHQSFKQSANYQTAEASYGASIIVPSQPLLIKKGVQRLERLVERLLRTKSKEQRTTLNQMANEADR